MTLWTPGKVHNTLYTGDADALVRQLVAQGPAVAGIEVRPASLEEAYLALTEEGT